MSGIIIFLAIFGAPVVFVYTQYNIRSFEIKEEYLNKRLIGHLLYEIQVSILQPCITECIHLGACESINFSRRNQTCELNDEGSETASPSEFVEEKGTVFSDVTNFHQIMAGVCSGHKCTDQQRCFPMGNHYDCKTIECGDLPRVPHGVFDKGGNIAGSIRKFSCPNGMNVNGSESITCLYNGTWSHFEAACTKEECGDLPHVSHGVFEPGGNVAGSIRKFSCPNGMVVDGSKNSTCLLNGTWSHFEAACIHGCDAPDLKTADVNPFINSSGLYAIVSCNASYISNRTTDKTNVVSKETLTCGNDGKWSPHIDCIYSKNLFNLALKKPTSQSSTVFNRSSEKGTDGIWNPIMTQESCVHIQPHNNEGEAWWEVDLQQIHPIRRINILVRKSVYYAPSFRRVTATVGNSSNPTEICGQVYDGPASSEEIVEFLCSIMGRYVRLSKPNFDNSKSLQLCEVGVYGN